MVNQLRKYKVIRSCLLLTSYLSGVINTLQNGKPLYNSVAHYGVYIAIRQGIMTLLGKQIAVLNRMYGCECCSRWMVSGDTAVILCYKDKYGSLTFTWECLECSGVSV